MLCFLLGLEAENLLSSPLIGPVFETFVFAEFRKKLVVSSKSGSLWYYRDAQGREVDFVLMQGGKLHLYEVKWAEKPDIRWAERIDEIADALTASKTQRMGDKWIICRAPIPFKVGKSQAVHAFDWKINS